MNPEPTIDWESVIRWMATVLVPILVAYITTRVDRSRRKKDEADTVASYSKTVSDMSDNYQELNKAYSELAIEHGKLRSDYLIIRGQLDQLMIEVAKYRNDQISWEKEKKQLAEQINELSLIVNKLREGVRILVRQLRAADIKPDFDIDEK